MRQFGYCTNVHAGANLTQTRSNLNQHAVAVKQRVSPSQAMGIGLWLSASSAASLTAGEIDEFADWLQQQQLLPFTLNGFPYGDFHQQVVKHRVYQPTWWQPERKKYTTDLIQIQHRLLPAGMEGSISTLPICWPQPAPSEQQLQTAARQLVEVANDLAHLEQQTGRLIYLCLEPEPGCYLQRSEDVVRWFEGYLLPAGDHEIVRRYLRVCHDVCHAVVMFESQEDVLRRYKQAGIQVGKVQISSAVCVPFDAMNDSDRPAAIDQLRSFAEDRYLHQTVLRSAEDGRLQFFEDLPAVLTNEPSSPLFHQQWRIHFHVPVYLKRFGWLKASQRDILECLQALPRLSQVTHFEVETYAWDVLPDDLRQSDLAAGIAEELIWFQQQL